MPASLVTEVNGAATKSVNPIIIKGTNEVKVEDRAEDVSCGEFWTSLRNR